MTNLQPHANIENAAERPDHFPANDNRSLLPPDEWNAKILNGDSAQIMKVLPANSFHAIITDPPYAKNAMTPVEYVGMLNAWLRDGHNPVAKGGDRQKKGIHGAGWDGAVPEPSLWASALRVLKPGGYLAAFMSEEKVDLLIAALRIAGFDIAHVMPWIKGTGWETAADLGINVQREIKRANGDTSGDKIVGHKEVTNASNRRKSKNSRLEGREEKVVPIYEVTEPGAFDWVGYKRCMNHAHEFIVIAMKPLSERSRAKNIVKHGTGALAVNVDGVGTDGKMASTVDPCFAPMFPWAVRSPRTTKKGSNLFMPEGVDNSHDCTKPLELIRWLTKLVCPKGGRVLDPFVGSGTGGVAAVLEQREFVGIELTAKHFEEARTRVGNAQIAMLRDLRPVPSNQCSVEAPSATSAKAVELEMAGGDQLPGVVALPINAVMADGAPTISDQWIDLGKHPNDNITCVVKTGHCLERLRELPDQSVDLCVTSPPYYKLRDYANDNQIGRETTSEVYIGALADVFREVRRVLKPSGNLYVNIDDIYQERELQCLPFKFVAAMTNEGWTFYNDLIWSKDNARPQSANGRFSRNHEYIFHFTKTENNYFDHEPVLLKGKTTKVHVRSANSENAKGSQFNRIECERKMWKQLKEKGYVTRRRGSVLTVQPNNSVSRKYQHYASFPPTLIEPLILSSCPPGGVVLDPFGGSGTTGLVATRTGRSAILIELNPEYAMKAADRLMNDNWKPTPDWRLTAGKPTDLG